MIQKTAKLSMVFVIILVLFLTACQPVSPTPAVESGLPEPTATQPDASVPPAAELPPTVTIAEHHSEVDLTRLTLGNQKISTSPQRDHVWSCMAQFSGNGAQETAAWLNGDGTWDLTKKLIVDGAVEWPHEFTITVEADTRVFQSNDLPDHPTGNYPISPNDDAYQVDRNPNSIKEQSVRLELSANPALAPQASCVGGEVGIMLSGVLIFNAFDANGRDAPANEAQDSCQGHPQNAGLYHYHSLSSCLEDTSAGHSALMGYAFDGFGIYGYYGEDGGELTNADLDECHGHTHMIEWDGQMVEMYHYHATHEFPYVVGCYRGTNSIHEPIGGQDGLGGQPAQEVQTQPGAPGGGQPPQEAFTACVDLTLNAACTINTQTGVLIGTCQMPPGSQQLACIPQGGPPP